ncbi:6528_t:CDS:2, partial [Cetraspora pellucida]
LRRDYEGYATMKDCNEMKMRLVVGLYVAEPLRDWIKDIVESAKAKYNVEMKIERLMNLKLNENESIISYTNRFDACSKKVKSQVSNREMKRWYLRGLPAKYRERINQRYPKTYKETKDWTIKIEKYEKSDEFDLKKTSTIGEESTYQMDPDVDDLANAFSELKIRQVSQDDQ